MQPKKWVLSGAGAVIIATVVGVVALGGASDPTSASQEPSPSTAKVEKGELSAMVSLNGTLTHRANADGSPYAVINQARGIYTKLPGGEKVDCGDVLYRVDDHPVLLLCGKVPAYRDLTEGEQGKDVRQLNQNLHELGYDADPDSATFTWETQNALQKLKRDKGLDATGGLHVDDAVFLPESVLISKLIAPLGGSARPGAEVAEATSDTLEVQVSLSASQQGAVNQGDVARIALPGNTSVTGKVERLGRVAQTDGNDAGPGSATIPIYISLDDPGKASGLDQAPVKVDITTKGVQDALSVPVLAIVGNPGGGFAVEVVRDSGRRELVAVKLGLFDTTAARVQVEGNVRVGDRVVVPTS